MATVIIVDDSFFARKLIRDTLEKAGYTILAEAADGYQAIEVFRLHKPDITTLDMVMPNANGLVALESIRHINPKAKVVMVTALEQKDAIRKAQDLGATDILPKPFDAAKLINAVLNAMKN